MQSHHLQPEARAEPLLLRIALGLAACAVTGVAWLPLLDLGFTGEDFVVFARHTGADVPEGVHVQRPLVDAWYGLLHSVFGMDSAVPYHAATLALHLLSTLILFSLARTLSGCAVTAFAAASLFGVGGGIVDSMAWISAMNRPLSSVIALTVVYGLALLLLERRRAGLWLFALGFTAHYMTHEESYGTGALAIATLPILALGRGRSRATRITYLLLPAAVLAALAVHFCFLKGQQGHEILVSRGVLGQLEAVIGNGWTQLSAILQGLGAGSGLGLLWLLALLGLLVRRLRVGYFVAAWTLASLLPYVFALERYRFYPSQAPVALLLTCGLGAIAAGFGGGRTPVRFVLGVVAVAGILGSWGPRGDRLARWHLQQNEISALHPIARELIAEDPERPVPMLANVGLSTHGLFQYYFRDKQIFGYPVLYFLDTPSCYTAAFKEIAEIPGPILGRRADATFGELDPGQYARKPRIDGHGFYGEFRSSGSLDETEALLASGEIDSTRVAVVEGFSPEQAGVVDPQRAKATFEIVEPLHLDDGDLAETVRIETAAPVFFVVQHFLLFHRVLFVAPRPYDLLSDMPDRRRARAVFTIAEQPELELPSYYANGLGVGVVIPPGQHTLQLRCAIQAAQELR